MARGRTRREPGRRLVMTVGVIGLGYVGLPLAVAFAEAGCEVIAVDVDVRKIESLVAGESYIEDVSSEAFREVAGRVHATSRYADLARTDAVLVCVPTPLTANREPDLGPLVGASGALAEVLQAGQLVVLESTTYPGTTRERVAPLLEERSGLVAGRDFFLAFSPERVDPGRTDFTLRNTPKVLGGLTEACAERAQALYGLVCDEIVRVSSPEAAELTKLLENIFRSVNIALVNELAMLTDRMGIDIWEVVDAAASKPYGFMRFEPGPGMGGHCLPVDPFYLSWRAREFDMATEFIELAGKVNQQMPYHCVAKAQRALNDMGMSVKGAGVAVIGVSYKPGVGDIRESPALKIISLLKDLGAQVLYHDPHVPALAEFALTSTPLEDALTDTDLAVIVTAHPSVDHEQIARRARLLLDLRGTTRTSSDTNVVRL
jgi:UDP-N-acetyl-D-glucosamine dehydrogenase